MSFFDDPEKCNVNFSIRMFGKEIRLDNEYEYDVSWREVLGDVVQALEASYGYSFDLEDLGIYYKGKEDTND